MNYILSANLCDEVAIARVLLVLTAAGMGSFCGKFCCCWRNQLQLSALISRWF